MKIIKKMISFFILAIVILNFNGCETKSKQITNKNLNDVLAKIDNIEIIREQLNIEIMPKIREFKNTYGEDFNQNNKVKDEFYKESKDKLNILIERKLLFLQAKKMNISEKDKDIIEIIDEATNIRLDKEFKGDRQKYIQTIKQEGFKDEKTYIEYTVESAMSTKVWNEFIKEIKPVTQEEINEYYEKNKSQYVNNNVILPLDKVNSEVKSDVERKKRQSFISNKIDELKKISNIKIFEERI